MDLRTLEIRIARGENLPVLPQVVSQVFKLVDNPSATPRDLEILINEDPALAAKILRVANSPTYGGYQIPSVPRAIAILGLNRVRSLLISVAFQHMVASTGEIRRFNRMEYWRHSMAVGTAAKVLAQHLQPMLAERIFCMGLMHDIGMIAMDKFCPEVLDSVISFAENRNVPLYEAETMMLPFNHAHLGGVLADRWALGPEMKLAIESHHDPEVMLRKETPGALLGIADIIAHETGFTNQLPSVPYQLPDLVKEAIGLTDEELDNVRAVMCAELQQAEQSLMIKAA